MKTKNVKITICLNTQIIFDTNNESEEETLQRVAGITKNNLVAWLDGEYSDMKPFGLTPIIVDTVKAE